MPPSDSPGRTTESAREGRDPASIVEAELAFERTAARRVLASEAYGKALAPTKRPSNVGALYTAEHAAGRAMQSALEQALARIYGECP